MTWLLVPYFAWNYARALEFWRFCEGPINEPLRIVVPLTILLLLFAGMIDTLRVMNWVCDCIIAKEPAL